MRETGNAIKEELINYMEEHPIINTHSHHLADASFEGFDLDRVIGSSYLQWIGFKPEKTRESRENYLRKVRYKSYFVWLQKGIQKLYDFDEEITAGNWERVSERIQAAHQDPTFHIKTLQNKCHYKKIIVETYWDPGSDNGRPEIFRPAFRIDSFLYGYAKGRHDFDGICPEIYGELPDNLTDYLDWVKNCIVHKKQQGCVALKSAVAYDRSLNFDEVTKEKAEKIFRLKDSQKTKEDIENFQNYLFWRICEMAAELSLPLQCHTGTGQLKGTRPIELNTLIRKNPETKFALLHCGYPWTEDIMGMVHDYQNVYPDLCWMPILSYTASVRSLHELIEASTIDKISWGCDTWNSEESYGALLAFRFVMADVLSKKIEDGYLSLEGAREIIDNIMKNNAAALYGIDC